MGDNGDGKKSDDNVQLQNDVPAPVENKILDQKKLDEFSKIDSMISSLGRRDDIVNQDILEADVLKSIDVTADRGDVLNTQDSETFVRLCKSFCKSVVKAEVNEKQFTGFYLSFIQAALNQSTSTKNLRNENLINTFKVDDQTYSWKTAHFIRFIKGHFPTIDNPIRQYLRGNENQVAILRATGKLKSDGHLAAKHGTTTQFWDSTSDFTNGCKVNISDDDLTANWLQRETATKGKNKKNTIYNVSQLASYGN
ncbi:CP [Beet pseudoyellows virus]|uniref:CP n=1 Tax=Beet pseudoyellows virus TaxID=72750 RepID=Q6VRA1_9CLOS|nr:CP [Beet pseudoyellows virus]AAQ97390.1 CP [Beet pseudoyellows virus]